MQKGEQERRMRKGWKLCVSAQLLLRVLLLIFVIYQSGVFPALH
jgi:hypothetical protein